MTWRSTTAALMTWARYRLDGRPLRSTSDFGGTGGGAPHERGAQITDGYDRVVEVERAVLATFADVDARPWSLRSIDTRVCREVFLALVVGRRLAKKIDPKLRGREAESAPGWKITPGVALELRIQDWEIAADHAGITPQQATVIVRVGLRQVTEALASRGLVPAPRRRKERVRMPQKQRAATDLLSGWKAIARYCRVSRKTAYRWHKLYGMPISRDRNGWPLGEPHVIDRWRKGNPEIGRSEEPDRAA